MRHPNLSDEINDQLEQSEQDGGVQLADVPVKASLFVMTDSRMYRIRRLRADTWTIEGHPRYCPKPIECRVMGSTWGGTMRKNDFIGKGMRMEFNTIDHLQIIRTSPIQNVYLVTKEDL